MPVTVQEWQQGGLLEKTVFNMEMTSRSQNFRLPEIPRRETGSPKDQSRLGNEQPRAYPGHRRCSAVLSTRLAHRLPILTLPKGTTFPCARQMEGLHKEGKEACMIGALKTSDHLS